MAGERLAKAIQQTAKKQAHSTESTDLLYGEVLSISPLKVKIDSRYTIEESNIILSSLCQEKWLTDIKNGTLLWRGLQAGDAVKILRVQNGQLFYIIEREGGLTI